MSDLDQRLRDLGTRWRDELPPSSADPRKVGSSRRTWVWAMAAAAVLLVILAAAVLQGRTEKPGPIAPVQPGRVVPHPTHARSLPGCAGNAIRVTEEAFQGAAAGTVYAFLDVTLRPGQPPCSITSRAQVTPLSRGRVLRVPVQQAAATGGFAGGPVTISHRVSGRIAVSWAVSHSCGIAGPNDQLRVELLGTTTLVPGFGRASCNPGEGVSPMQVGPVQPHVH